MSTIAEQFSSAAKANLEANLALFTNFTAKAFEGVEKLVELNLTAAKASFEDSSASTQKLLTAKDPQEFFSLSVAQAQPNTEKVIAYGRHFASIASATQAELTKAAEAQVAETKRKAVELIEQVSKSAPAGSEGAIAFVNAAIGNASAGYEQFTKSTKQAVEAIESNVNSAVDQLSQATAKSAARTTKK